MKDWLSRCNQNKRKTVAPHTTHLMCSLVLLLTISLWLVEKCSYLASVFHICLHTSTSLLRITYPVLQKSCQANFSKFQGSRESRFDGFKKDCYFLKIPKWKDKPVLVYKQGKLVSYFLNNAIKTCLYGLKISENIKIEHAFQSKAFFLFSSNPHTSCLSAFNFETLHLLSFLPNCAYNTWSHNLRDHTPNLSEFSPNAGKY